MSWPQDAFLYLRQIATPKGRPQTGGNLLYTKSDNNLYLMNADGTEHAVSGGGGGGVASITAGTNITVDNTIPTAPVVAAPNAATKTGVETLTNKDLTDATNVFPSALATDAEVTTAVSNHAALTATHGATGAVVGTTNTQTLTNKDLTSTTNTFPPSIAQFLGSAISTADIAAAITVEVQVANVSFSVVSGAVYRIWGWAQVKSNAAAGFSTLTLRTDTVSTGVTGTFLAQGVKDHRVAGRVEALPVLGLFTAASTGTLFAKVTVTGGGGQSTATGTSSPSILTVERIA